MASVFSDGHERDRGGYVVRRPRVTDAIGAALRRGYEHRKMLPDEMLRLLDRLDRASRRN